MFDKIFESLTSKNMHFLKACVKLFQVHIMGQIRRLGVMLNC
jgi:hypothetical protein